MEVVDLGALSEIDDLPSMEPSRNGSNLGTGIELLMNDKDTHGIVMIGEIGGGMEAEAARYIKAEGTKPVVGFIAGETAPAGRTMGHAGAIISGGKGLAKDKIEIMKSCGITVANSPADIGKTLFDKLKT